jgi:protein-S-isoprenylcysteine O-methyltransferase Ste14
MALEPAVRWRNFPKTKAYDLLAATPLILWYLLGLRKQMPLTLIRVNELRAGTIPLLDALQLVALAGSFVLTFMLIYALVARKTPSCKAKGILPRAVALSGTFLGNAFLFLTAVQLPLAAQVMADLFIIGGTLGAMLAMSQLGGAFSVMPEARKLVTTGPYAIIRHPLYLAEMVGVIGLILQFQQPWALLLGLAVFGFQYWRTISEENVLSRTYPDYAAYVSRTWRFIPFLF